MEVGVLTLLPRNIQLVQDLHDLPWVRDEMLGLSSPSTDCACVYIDVWWNTEVFELLHDEINLSLIVSKSQLENLLLELLHFSLNSIEVLEHRLRLSIISNIQNEIYLFWFELFNAISWTLNFNKRPNEFILKYNKKPTLS